MGQKSRKFFLIIIIIFLLFGGMYVLGIDGNNPEKASSISEAITENKLLIIQENSLLQTSVSSSPVKVVKTIKVIITGYSSTPFETDADPFITAAGTQVRDGIVANNLLPLGTKIRIPELYGDRIFIVEDRMNWKKGPYHVDIWFPSYWEAKNFGAKTTLIEILEG